jgi:hypothetical protein
MALRRGTSFTGIAGERLQVGEPITAADMATIADDQGFNFEKLTNKSAADGTSAPTVSGHNHSEAGNLIFRHISSVHWGAGGSNSSTWNPGALTTYSAPYCIITNSSTTAVALRALAHLMFIPRGFTDRNILVLFDVDGDPRFTVDVLDSTLTGVSGYTDIPVVPALALSGSVEALVAESGLAAVNTYGFVFSVSSAGLYALDFSTTLEARNEIRRIRAMHIFAVFDPAQRQPSQDAPELASGTNVTVGDPDNSNAWHAVDDKLVTANEALHSATTVVLTHNNHRIYEQFTGNAMPGNAAITATAHDHRGSDQRGAELEMTVWGATWGGDGRGLTEMVGNRCNAVENNTTTATPVGFGRVYMPASANTTDGVAGTSKVKFAALVRSEPTKFAGARVLATFGSGTRTLDDPGAADTLVLLTTTVEGYHNFGYTEDAVNECLVETACLGGGDITGQMKLYSCVFYLDQ